jgi:hypothetical protein
MFADRVRLGDIVTQWLEEHPQLDIVVTRSSDGALYCLTISIFYFEQAVGIPEPKR